MWGRLPSFSKVIIRVLEIAGAGLTSALVAYVLGRTETPPPAPAPAVVHLAPADEEMIRTVRSDQAALLDQLRNSDARKSPTVQAIPPQAVSEATSQAPAQAAPPAAPSTDVAVSATDLLPITTPIKRVKIPQTATTAVAPPPAATPPAATSPAVTPPSPQVSARREHKPERVRVGEAKPRLAPQSEPRAEGLPQVRPAGGAIDPAARNGGQRDVAAVPTSQPAPVAQAPAPESDTGLTSALKGFGSRLLPSRDRLPVPDEGAVRPPMPVGEFQQSAMSGGMRSGPSNF